MTPPSARRRAGGAGPAATNGYRPLFVNLAAAAVRGSRNYHRLDHLGRYGTFMLNEETITDLLLGEMAGKEYAVQAPCTACAVDGTCPDWDGAALASRGGVQVRALTKIEEGGNRRTRRRGAHADFVLAVENRDPDLPDYLPGGQQLRMLVQAKRVAPGRTFLHDAVVRRQYDGLLQAAAAHGAVPYYALYVQQNDPHTSSPTRCPRHTTAADRSIVLVAARPTADPAALPGRSTDSVIADGRPLRCIGGCACTGTASAGTAWEAVAAFIAQDFKYSPTDLETPMPPGVPRVTTNIARTKPGGSAPPRQDMPPAPAAGAAGGVAGTDVLIVRLGQQAPSPTPDRLFIGYSPGMTADQVREAARMYWRVDAQKARNLRYVIAASGRQPLQAYRVAHDGVIFTTGADGQRRASFDLIDVTEDDVRRRLLEAASAALAALRRGSQNPVLYLRRPRST